MHILVPVTLGWGPLQAIAAPRNDRNSQGMIQEAASAQEFEAAPPQEVGAVRESE